MAILLDPPAWPAHGLLWSHLASDTSLEELHAFAVRTGLPRRGFEGDHYDVPEWSYDALVAAGAQPVSARDLVRALHVAGLRLRHRVGDRPVDRVSGLRLGGAVIDVDLVVSRRPAPGLTVGVAVLLRDARDRVALVHHRGRWTPPTAPVRAGEAVDAVAHRLVRAAGSSVSVPVPVAPQVRRAAGGPSGHLAVLDARVDDPNGATPYDWVDHAELARRCAQEFWWPIPAYLWEIGEWARPRS